MVLLLANHISASWLKSSVCFQPEIIYQPCDHTQKDTGQPLSSQDHWFSLDEFTYLGLPRNHNLVVINGEAGSVSQVLQLLGPVRWR